jgi:hypothetical protein
MWGWIIVMAIVFQTLNRITKTGTLSYLRWEAIWTAASVDNFASISEYVSLISLPASTSRGDERRASRQDPLQLCYRVASHITRVWLLVLRSKKSRNQNIFLLVAASSLSPYFPSQYIPYFPSQYIEVKLFWNFLRQFLGSTRGFIVSSFQLAQAMRKQLYFICLCGC